MIVLWILYLVTRRQRHPVKFKDWAWLLLTGGGIGLTQFRILCVGSLYTGISSHRDPDAVHLDRFADGSIAV